ncbi:hypothetical protein Peur_051082 [Populus x canadensis]
MKALAVVGCWSRYVGLDVGDKSSSIWIDGGSAFPIKVTWSQKLLHHEGQFCLNVPFARRFLTGKRYCS